MLKKKFIFIFIIAALTWLISVYLHDPGTPVLVDQTGLKYSDIIHGVFYTRFKYDSIKEWFNDTAFRDFIKGEYKCPLPYIDYHFEYPPVIGFLWYASTCVAFSYTRILDNAARLHYYIQALFILVFTILCSITLSKISQRVSLGNLRYLLLLSPTMVIYLVYNWDIIAITLALLGVLAFINKKYLLSGILLGASFSTKLLTAGIAYYFFTKLVITNRDWAKTARYLVGFILTGVIPFAALYILSPRGFMEMLQHHASWYCENCLYMVLVNDIWSPLHRKLSISIIASYVLLLTLLLTPRNEDFSKSDLEYIFVYGSILVLFNYVFSPQMLIMVTPLAILVLKRELLVEYIIADISNALLIIAFFHELYIGGNPWTLGSLTQDFALARNILFLLILIQVTLTIAWHKLKEVSNSPNLNSA